eukprot:3393865-Pyramimonas_sp.AAC.1
MTFQTILRQSNMIESCQHSAEAKAVIDDEHPAWDGRRLGRRRDIPAVILEECGYDGDVSMHLSDGPSSAQGSSLSASGSGVTCGHHLSQPPLPQHLPMPISDAAPPTPAP